jgi:TPR repeat protein
MPIRIISCVSLPPATIKSVPIYDYANANVELAKMATETYYSCCGKSICKGCVDSFLKSENIGKCPFCNSVGLGKTDEDNIQELMKRAEANDAGAMTALGSFYYHGIVGLQQDQKRAMELWTQASKLGYSDAHFNLGIIYDAEGNLKKAKFHTEAAAMAGHGPARSNLGYAEEQAGNMEQAVKHWKIAASAGDYDAMHSLLGAFKKGYVSRETIDSTLTAYNNSCTEMRSKARDSCIRFTAECIGER